MSGISSFAQASFIPTYTQLTEKKANIVMRTLDLSPGGLGFMPRITINYKCAPAQVN